MTQRHQEKHSPGFEFSAIAFDPEPYVRQWQTRTTKMLQAQEHIAKSMSAAIRAQLRYGQEVMAERMNMLRWDGLDATHATAQMQKEMEHFSALIKEISSEIRGGFNEANDIMKTLGSASKAKHVEPKVEPEPAPDAQAEAESGGAPVAEPQHSAPKAAAAPVRRAVRRSKV